MHYFHVGGDDRVLLNSIALDLNLENIEVQNSNLTLKTTIEVFQNAYFNVGMRFHSIVLQTISSGKNYILDYTEPNKGKTIGFLKDIDNKRFFKDRYVSIQEDEITLDIIKDTNEKFLLEESEVMERLNIYINELTKISMDVP
jgi:polysaccharide pyruvyl transferase WcaK-like protein